ncbi:MAG: Phosphoribosylamine--glycine ligase [Verrucomicrobiae bacterium]|nr:Phosphoribosylamine--glycine ligase [Verrucomicrobiae bacterium]
MKVLVIGGGGREHALVWKLAQSRHVTKLFCTPGNPGIAHHAECVTPADLPAFAAANQIDLTVVGPEVPLCAGIADQFQAKGLRLFGPNKAAARLEGSKAFSKTFMLKHGVPTAPAGIFNNPADARAYVRKNGAPIVVKADGLAAGKGVIVAKTVAEAEQAIADIMEKRVFGEAGAQVVIEECLVGEEASVMAFVDGRSFKIMVPAQDHKRVGDGDTGPNTGGMGAYSPMGVPVDATEIFTKTLAGLQAEGIDYRGVLYAGLMLTPAGPKVIEFNCRFGDPETQVVVPRMDFDLVEACLATADGTLDKFTMTWKKEAAVCVVMTAGGYPGSYPRGQVIAGLKEAGKLANVAVFHAGTKQTTAGLVTDGGRVLGVTGLGANISAALERAYAGVKLIQFDGAHYRRDIAARYK